MPLRKRPLSPRILPLSPDTIDGQRQTYIATIQQARALNAGQTALLDNAESLLTVRWAHATWKSREGLLRTVDWLLRVAINNPAPRPSRPGPMRMRDARA